MSGTNYCSTCNNYIPDRLIFSHKGHNITPSDWKEEDLRGCEWCFTKHPKKLMERIDLDGTDKDGIEVETISAARCQKCRRVQQGR